MLDAHLAEIAIAYDPTLDLSAANFYIVGSSYTVELFDLN